MKTLKIYDPAMCCSTGICGPKIEPKLVQLAANVSFLKSKGITVERFNLAHDTHAFTSSPLVLSEMGGMAEDLPLFVIDEEIMAKGRYPSRSEMASWFGLDAETTSEGARVTLKMTSSECCDPNDSGCC